MDIEIEYLTIDGLERKKVNIIPDDYFDKDPDGFNIYSTPKFIFPYEYLDIPKDELILVSLYVKDGLSYVKRDMFFWNEGKNETDYYISFSHEAKEIFEWMILSKIYKNKANENILENIKMLKDSNGTWIVTNNLLSNLENDKIEDVYINVYKEKFGFINGFRSLK